jgi:hypothetical protein
MGSVSGVSRNDERVVSPIFYLGDGVAVDVLHDLPIRCEESEILTFYTVNGTSCGQYAQDVLKSATDICSIPPA